MAKQSRRNYPHDWACITCTPTLLSISKCLFRPNYSQIFGLSILPINFIWKGVVISVTIFYVLSLSIPTVFNGLFEFAKALGVIFQLSTTVALLFIRWLKVKVRPKLKPGYYRLEWTCVSHLVSYAILLAFALALVNRI